MAARRIIVDTSVIIDFLRKKNKENTHLWKIQENDICFMSSITLFELLSGAKAEKHFDDIKTIMKWIQSIYFDDDIADTAAAIFRELKARNQIIEYRDIFIAATARCYDFWVATLNVGHFERIDGLKLHGVN